MTDCFGFVTQAFDNTVSDLHVEIVQYSILMVSQQPGEVTHQFYPRMGRPPEPFCQETFSPTFTCVSPQFTKALLQEIHAVDLQVELLKIA